MANSPTTPEQSVREQLGLIDVWLKEMSIRTVETWEDARLNQAATAAVWIETSEKIKTLLDQISAERETKIREDLIALLPDRKPMPGDARAESNLQYAAALVQERKGWNAYRKAATVVLRQPTGEEK